MGDMSGEILCSGVIKQAGAKFGFVTQDSGEPDLFVMPFDCGGEIPPTGTRINYTVGIDKLKGKPKAENVVAEDGQQFGAAAASAVPTGDKRAGVIKQAGDKFGFITQEDGSDMFVLPLQCMAFGGVVPAIGTQVQYDVVMDGKTQRERADNVEPVGGPGLTGTVKQCGEKFGFITQNDGGEDLFMMPFQCAAFGNTLPPIGTQVTYSVGVDPKTQRPRAEDVAPFGGGGWGGGKGKGGGVQLPWSGGGKAAAPYGKAAAPYGKAAAPKGVVAVPAHLQPGYGKAGGKGKQVAPPMGGGYGQPHLTQGGGYQSGTVKANKGAFGFITQDSGEADLFVLPTECEAFGTLPEAGTRVMYTLGVDAKKGQPKAENVQPEGAGSWGPAAPAKGKGKGKMQVKGSPAAAWGGKGAAAWGGGPKSGTMKSNNGKFGFIIQDSGEPDMFVMPLQCEGFGGTFPEDGVRLSYTVALDPKSGKPRAETVNPEGAAPAWGGAAGMASQASLGVGLTGVIKYTDGKKGFITQDSGETDMFVMPLQCAAFGGVIPEVGTRVLYSTVMDKKSARPRAEDVQPEDGAGAGGVAHAGPY